jgi:hypothetical protein
MASRALQPIEASLSPELRKLGRAGLRDFLTDYFHSDAGDCTKKRASAISPYGGGPFYKRLKVRWGLPGHAGKSGGLRLAIAVACEQRIVWIAGAWARKDDPADVELETAFSGIPPKAG